MKLTNFLVITLYTLSFFVIGSFLVCLSSGLITLPEVINNVTQFYYSFSLNTVIIGIIGVLLISISFLFVIHSLEGIFGAEKDILFSGSSGMTTVSFSALEDIIKRAGSQFLDIREIKPRVVIKKKGLDILVRVVFYSGVNIPEISERLQSSIKDRLRHVLGIEDEIRVKIHVAKIIEKSRKELKRDDTTRRMELGE
ncbi:MAG: alkaline shock response membrane anchor protein AmaP [Candidatus Omnitrophota bacterium]|nr:alkaline shock response membrane anchor protein AmaP [Candidatus Omnitrophota bacterium]